MSPYMPLQFMRDYADFFKYLNFEVRFNILALLCLSPSLTPHGTSVNTEDFISQTCHTNVLHRRPSKKRPRPGSASSSSSSRKSPSSIAARTVPLSPSSSRAPYTRGGCACCCNYSPKPSLSTCTATHTRSSSPHATWPTSSTGTWTIRMHTCIHIRTLEIGVKISLQNLRLCAKQVLLAAEMHFRGRDELHY